MYPHPEPPASQVESSVSLSLYGGGGLAGMTRSISLASYTGGGTEMICAGTVVGRARVSPASMVCARLLRVAGSLGGWGEVVLAQLHPHCR